VLNHMLAELATVLADKAGDHMQHILDWEDEETACLLPSSEPSRKISRYLATNHLFYC